MRHETETDSNSIPELPFWIKMGLAIGLILGLGFVPIIGLVGLIDPNYGVEWFTQFMLIGAMGGLLGCLWLGFLLHVAAWVLPDNL